MEMQLLQESRTENINLNIMQTFAFYKKDALVTNRYCIPRKVR